MPQRERWIVTGIDIEHGTVITSDRRTGVSVAYNVPRDSCYYYNVGMEVDCHSADGGFAPLPRVADDAYEMRLRSWANVMRPVYQATFSLGDPAPSEPPLDISKEPVW